ncbi:MAG: hypothetical protein R2753_13425 [Chitinophagales bacterium]
MVFNTTLRTKKTSKAIDEIVGKTLPLLKIWKLGGTGSRRMIIEQASPNLSVYLNPDHYPTYSSIEIRQKGILVHINQAYRTFAWPIPYYQLALYNSNAISIHASGDFIKYRQSTDNVHFKFVKKVLAEKASYLAGISAFLEK